MGLNVDTLAFENLGLSLAWDVHVMHTGLTVSTDCSRVKKLNLCVTIRTDAFKICLH